MFAGIGGVLEKGAAYAEAKGVEESVLLNWRVYPDMFPLTRQVQIATELPARCMARLAGAELPKFDDNETTFGELQDRVRKAQAIIASYPGEAVDANPDADITVPVGPSEMTFTRRNYVQHFLLPNLYFHTTATYLILRGVGVDLGKRDFLAVPL